MNRRRRTAAVVAIATAATAIVDVGVQAARAGHNMRCDLGAMRGVDGIAS